MHPFRPFAFLLLLAGMPLLGACSSGQPSSNGIASTIDKSIATAMDKAQTKLRTEPIEVSHNDPNLPKAEITPDGNFIVGGKTVAITPTQRSALLDYRKQLVAVATQGIEIGKQGASVGLHAASAAISGVFSGKSDQEIEQSVKAQTTGIREAAAKICDRLPAMMAEQQKLAAVLPAFKPYATMTEKDISDCRNDALHDDDTSRAEVRRSIRERIRTGIRSRIQTAAQASGLASRGTPDSDAATSSSSASQHRER